MHPRKAVGPQTYARMAIAVAALALLTVSSITSSAIANAEILAPGDLDPSFADRGSTVLPAFPSLDTTHSTLLVKPDGKLLIGTQGGIPFQLDSDGMPDSSYQWIDVSASM